MPKLDTVPFLSPRRLLPRRRLVLFLHSDGRGGLGLLRADGFKRDECQAARGFRYGDAMRPGIILNVQSYILRYSVVERGILSHAVTSLKIKMSAQILAGLAGESGRSKRRSRRRDCTRRRRR